MKGFDRIDLRRTGASLAAMAVVLAVPGVAQAQMAEPGSAGAGCRRAGSGRHRPRPISWSPASVAVSPALDMKRTESGSTDSILAEDIGEFPDLNLVGIAQRIPGVALLRDGGAGRRSRCAGLGPHHPRPYQRAVGGDRHGGRLGSERRHAIAGRGFDSTCSHRTCSTRSQCARPAQAETEEGSLGATVDLRTARPFDGKAMA